MDINYTASGYHCTPISGGPITSVPLTLEYHVVQIVLVFIDSSMIMSLVSYEFHLGALFLAGLIQCNNQRLGSSPLARQRFKSLPLFFCISFRKGLNPHCFFPSLSVFLGVFTDA